MKQKKCINCLCMVDVKAKNCTFCGTPFKAGNYKSVDKKGFSPPSVVSQEQKDLLRNSLNTSVSELLTPEQVEALNKRIKVKVAMDSYKEEKAKKQELINTRMNILRERIERFGAVFFEVSPYRLPEFDFESLEIAEVYRNEDVFEDDPGATANTIDVDLESLNELNEMARSFAGEEIEGDTEEDEIVEEGPRTFETKEVLRTLEKKVEKKSEPESEKKKAGLFKDAINELSDLSTKSEKTPVEEKKVNGTSIDEISLDSLEDFGKKVKTKVPKTSKEELNLDSLEDFSKKTKKKVSKPDAKKPELDFSKAIESLELEDKPAPPPPKTSKVSTKKVETSKTTVEKTHIEKAPASEGNEAAAALVPVKTRIVYQSRGSHREYCVKLFEEAKKLCVQGEYDKALVKLEAAVRQDPAYEQAHILLSRTFIKLKFG